MSPFNYIPLPAVLSFALVGVCLVVSSLPVTFAVSAGAPMYCHFLYMFDHASVLHLAVNMCCLVTLAGIFTPLRIIMAYVVGVAVSFISSLFAIPTLGASVFVFFLYGFAAPYLWYRNRMGLLVVIAFMIAGVFLPWIASALHIVMFVAGFVYWLCRSLIYHITE